MVDEPQIIASDGTVRRGESVPAGVGFDFKVRTADLIRIAVDHRTTLEFEDVTVVLESAFELCREGATHLLDPGVRLGLGPLLALYPDRLSSLGAEGDGTLRLGLGSGAELVVPPTPDPYEPWQVHGPGDALVVCAAGGNGQLAVWS